jgi:peptide/nickel transport system permease protein
MINATNSQHVPPSTLHTPEPKAPYGRSILRSLRAWPAQLLLGGAILLMFILVALTVDLWAPYNYSKIGAGLPLSPASAEHWFGTDQLGRDVFSRVAYGTRYELMLALSGTALGLVIGALLGLLSGYLGGWFDDVVMRFCEAFISIPFIVLALMIIAAAGPQVSGSPLLLIGVIGTVYAPRIARMARAVALELSTRDYITAARLRGESAWSIVMRELLPNASGTLLVEFAVRAGYAPILIGSLGFLGFGARPPIPEWGLMISENRVALVTTPITVLGPGLALALLVIGLNLCTDGLARMLGHSVRRGQ